MKRTRIIFGNAAGGGGGAGDRDRNLRQRVSYAAESSDTDTDRDTDTESETDSHEMRAEGAGALSSKGAVGRGLFVTINRSNIAAAVNFFKPIGEKVPLAKDVMPKEEEAFAAPVAIAASAPIAAPALALAAAVASSSDATMSSAPVVAMAEEPVASVLATPVLVAIAAPRLSAAAAASLGGGHSALTTPDARIYAVDSPTAIGSPVLLEHARRGASYSPHSVLSFDGTEELEESLKGMQISSSKFRYR